MPIHRNDSFDNLFDIRNFVIQKFTELSKQPYLGKYEYEYHSAIIETLTFTKPLFIANYGGCTG